MRELALLTGILTALESIKPLAQTVDSIRRTPPATTWEKMSLAGISRRLQLLGRAAALGLGILMAADLPRRLSALANNSAEASKLDLVTNALDLLFQGAAIALLIALSRDRGEWALEEISVGRLLRVASEMAVVVFGLVVIDALLRVVVIPHYYSLARDYAYQQGRALPPIMDLLMPPLRRLVQQSCLFVIPFLVWRGWHTASGPGVPVTVPGPTSSNT